MSAGPAKVEILDPVDRLLHGVVLLGVGGALATGPLLAFPGLGVGAGALHAGSAYLALLGGAFHLVKVCLSWLEGRNPWGLVLRPADLATLGRGLAWALRLCGEPPRFGRFSYRERLAYAGFLILIPLLLVTGWAVAHPGRSWVLGAPVLLGAARLHAAAGLLLLLALAWHLYFALLQPGALFWNGSWLTGKAPWQRVEQMRPEWAREIVAALAPAEEAQESPSVEALLEAGNLHAREGRYEESARAYEAALALYPGYSQALFNLGVVRFRAGDARGAAEALESFLQEDPFGSMAPRARDLLARLGQGRAEP